MSSLVAGGVAGTSADVALFPIDTVKTRLQSAQGFWRSGGFRGIYRGLSAAAAGSAPGSAIFFGSYTLVTGELKRLSPTTPDPIVHMSAATCGGVVAAVVRVPTEVVKQRVQAGLYRHGTEAVAGIVRTEGYGGLWRGYLSTLAREIPFSLVQFPLYEFLKTSYSDVKGAPPKPWEAALVGSVAGAIAAGITTPLDLAKTRIMLSNDPNMGTVTMLRQIYREEGFMRLFSGISPRVTWISIGGFIFFGSFEATKVFTLRLLADRELASTARTAHQQQRDGPAARFARGELAQ